MMMNNVALFITAFLLLGNALKTRCDSIESAWNVSTYRSKHHDYLFSVH